MKSSQLRLIYEKQIEIERKLINISMKNNESNHIAIVNLLIIVLIVILVILLVDVSICIYSIVF